MRAFSPSTSPSHSPSNLNVRAEDKPFTNDTEPPNYNKVMKIFNMKFLFLALFAMICIASAHPDSHKFRRSKTAISNGNKVTANPCDGVAPCNGCGGGGSDQWCCTHAPPEIVPASGCVQNGVNPVTQAGGPHYGKGFVCMRCAVV